MGGSGSVAARRQVGRSLRLLREAARKTRADVAAARICSRSKLEHIEHGMVSIRPGDVRELCLCYGADAETTEALAALAYGTSQPGWWEQHSAATPPWFRLYLGLEAVAREIRTYEPEVVPGFFQTPAYARAVERATLLGASDTTVARNVQLRQDRQRNTVARPRPLRIHSVLAERALLTRTDPPQIMREQISHLYRLNRLGHVDIHVLRSTAEMHPAVMGGFSVLDFDDPADPSVAYLESYGGARYPETPSEVDGYRRRFEAIRRMSVPIQEYNP
jgi:transcriptional regulator with XRE-family HTH domain